MEKQTKLMICRNGKEYEVLCYNKLTNVFLLSIKNNEIEDNFIVTDQLENGYLNIGNGIIFDDKEEALAYFASKSLKNIKPFIAHKAIWSIATENQLSDIVHKIKDLF